LPNPSPDIEYPAKLVEYSVMRGTATPEHYLA
jgi:hypothetical protein